MDGFSKATSRTKEMKWKNTLAAVLDRGPQLRKLLESFSLMKGPSLISCKMAACYYDLQLLGHIHRIQNSAVKQSSQIKKGEGRNEKQRKRTKEKRRKAGKKRRETKGKRKGEKRRETLKNQLFKY